VLDEPPADAPRAIRVAVVSDLNSSYGKTTYRDEVHASARWIARELRPDLVISTGDHVAGMKRGVDLDGMWSGFHAAFTDELARAGVPFAPTPGNHDASAYDAYAGERERYVAEWEGRRPEVDFVDDAHYPLRYAFRSGPALFVSLDVTVARALDDAQLAWLEGVLARGADAPVKVVFGHIPLRAFVGGKKRDEVVRDARLEAALERAGVDAYLSGHHHAYYPGRSAGMRMVAMPCLGSGARKLVGTQEASARGVVVLEIDAGGVRSVESHTASSGFVDVVPRQALPERLGDGERAVWRDDVSPGRALARRGQGALRRGPLGL
jgi:3',5'-cyclic AMP phosphodiesterase CpdA